MIPMAHELPEYLRTSWHRCGKMMQRDFWTPPHRAQGVTFESICRRKTAMLTLGQAALEDAWEYMAPRRCALLILDESACILSLCGDDATQSQLADLGFSEGAYCAESIIGSCALSLAPQLGQPVKSAGTQHFKHRLHDWSFCATPIFDNHGRLSGTIGLCCLAGDGADSDLALTLAIAREVGNSLLTDSLLAESNRHLNQLYGLLASMDDGVMSWNARGILEFINAEAARMLHLDAEAAHGKKLSDMLTLPAVLQRAIRQNRTLTHLETSLESQHQFVDAVVTLKPIAEAQGNSYILLLHPIEKMRQLMTSQLGKVSHTFANMAQDDPQTQRIVHFGRQAARGGFPVLLCGEEGVGKELLSQAIHNASDRAEGPYIAVNCQLEAEQALGFNGAFSDDESDGRLSRLELANGGTLYLEKIEYLAPELQSALLQVIKQGVIARMDARRFVPVDIKVIAATTVDLARLVEQNRFSRQLYYALHAFEISIPPLRQRRNSIPSLVKNRLRRLEKRFSLRLSVDDDVLTQLITYDWPGNDFELTRVLENTALRSHSGRIHLSQLPEYLFNEHHLAIRPDSEPLPASLCLADREREAIIHAARVTGGSIQEMVSLLKIGRTTLWRKMKQYDIDAAQYKHNRESSH